MAYIVYCSYAGPWPGEGATDSSWCKQAAASELWDLSKPSSLRNRFYKLSRKEEGWQPAQAWHQYSKSAEAGSAPATQQRAPAQLLSADPAENFCPSQPHVSTLWSPLVPRRRRQARTAFDCGYQTFSRWQRIQTSVSQKRATDSELQFHLLSVSSASNTTKELPTSCVQYFK